MHLRAIAHQAPSRPAVIMGASELHISFAELDARTNRLARLFRARGLEVGSSVAILLENHERFLEVAWAAQRSGLYYTTINWHLTPDEAAYILADCAAELVVTSAELEPLAAEIARSGGPPHRLMIGGTSPGWESYEVAVAEHSPEPVDDECEGDVIVYSSGTTGRPKGVKRPLTAGPLGKDPLGVAPFLRKLGVRAGDVYLSTAPLYHAAPLTWAIAAQRLGATVVIMERFDPAKCLQLIERHSVTHAQFVPTMFVRLLKLDDAVRASYDLSSLKAVVHAAAPCPVDVKQRMIEWFGPVIHEYYSSTEGIGATWVDSHEWLAHPGTVGKAGLGRIHILDDDGNELQPGHHGTVWFEGGRRFEYHNDPEKTRAATNDRGWATVGDVGYLDDEGYLYLTDRRSFMIISGGVNIYPREIEDVLVGHPKVMDAAVIGVPNEDFGEEVKAVVQPIDWSDAGSDLEDELMQLCQRRLARYKCPRSIDFERELPRQDTGKLYKRLLRDRYWTAS